jgi:nitroreductase
VMRTTFAAREFTGEPLPDHVLYRILDNARFAPSGGNRQAVRIIVVRDQQTRDRLAELSVPGAQRYVAQLGIGEAPWNPLRPSGVPAADVDTPRFRTPSSHPCAGHPSSVWCVWI